MHTTAYHCSGKTVTCYHNASLSMLGELVPQSQTVIITDTHVRQALGDRLNGWKLIAVPAGEASKQQSVIDGIIDELVKLEADRKTWIVGIGGGVVTDMAGYVAGIYMRGLNVGFVPTSLLGMVDASIGGKNGIDKGLYKNLLGLVRQPAFLLYDHSLLETLPHEEWVNGFAEIIKHAAIKDAALFEALENASPVFYKQDGRALAGLLEKNIAIKAGVVERDEFEAGERKQLNFGHTFGHAIENLYQLPHGHAISIGMVLAASLSEQLLGFPAKDKQRLISLLEKYGLPVAFSFPKKQLLALLKMDKKREQEHIHFILLNKLGEAAIQPVRITALEDFFDQYD